MDSNGSISMTDGNVIVSGPTNNGNGSLDYDQTLDISGGLLIAAGSSGMVQAASEDSKQHSVLMTYPETQAAGTILHLEDSKGNTVATFAPEKTTKLYSSVLQSLRRMEHTPFTLMEKRPVVKRMGFIRMETIPEVRK